MSQDAARLATALLRQQCQLDLQIREPARVFTGQHLIGRAHGCLAAPGLPKFGFKFDPKINACQILKKVTGEMVEAANKKMQATVDETLGTGMDVDISAQDMAEERAARANRR